MRLSPNPALLVVSMLGAVSSAAAQTAAAPAAAATKAAPAEDAVSEVVVTGERAAVVTSIDRKSYNVARDLSATTGSVSDAMRNLPSVDVDVDGNVSLRGESSVQILLDGKPSAMFSGSNRAQALQQLPANTVESIEVITNPSAEFSPDGTGGVINIVTKKNRKSGASGSIQAGKGVWGRWSLNSLASYKTGKLNLTGSLGVRYLGNEQISYGQNTRIDPILQQRTDTVFSGRNDFGQDSVNITGTADYDLTPKDRLTVNLALFGGEAESSSLYTDVRRDGAGVVRREFDTLTSGASDNHNINLSTGWRHAFAREGQTFNLTARYTASDFEFLNRTRYTYRTPVDVREEERRSVYHGNGLGLSASYVVPLATSGSFKLGYDYRRDVDDQDVSGALINVGGPPSNLPNVTNRFIMVSGNHQAYATWQRPFGKLTVLGGARLELAQITYDQRTSVVSGDDDYFDVHPSLHVQYALTSAQNLTLSYSHRVQRPGGSQLNPFLVVENEFNARSGNPNLRPQETHSLEAAWAWQESGRSAGATLYYRQNYNVIGPVSRFLTPTVVLNTFENQGESVSGGLELDAGGRFGGRVTYRANANISYNEIQRSTFAGGGTREAFAYTVKSNLDYKPTDKDLIQLSANYSGRQIFAQGYRLASGGVNFGYQHKFRPNLVGTVTIYRLFGPERYTTVTDTPTLFGQSISERRGNTVNIGIIKTFGGRQIRDGQLGLDSGGGGGEAP